LDRLAGNSRTADAATAQRVVKHLRDLAANDMSHAQIAASAGVAQSTVSDLIAGRTSPLSKNATKLLQVRRTDRTDTCMVSAVGAKRRLQALYWMRHPSRVVASETGLHEDTILGMARGRYDRTTAARVQRVRDAYDRLAMRHGSSEFARRFAVENGWHGPLAWDDDTIDDPNAVPQTDAAPAGYTEGEDVAARFLMGESVVLDDAGRREVITHLMEWTQHTPAEIADRLEMSPDAVSRSWERIKRKARDEGRKAPWRRVYVPLRDMDLTQDELRSVA
jgi:transcriptional regulator with XRE-family HTH domain